MVREGFTKFCWGFLFILFDFRIQGVDIFPNIIGFVLFAIGFQTLAGHSEAFGKAKPYTWTMVALSIFTLYQRQGEGSGIFGNLLSLVALILTIIIVYYLLEGVRDMATSRQQAELAEEAIRNWRFYLAFELLALANSFLIFFPPIFFLMVIGLSVMAIFVLIVLMRLMLRCREQFAI